MLFNSVIFFVFFAIVYFIYLLLNKQFKIQNRILLLASYIFYGFWDYRFLALIFISTVADFIIGQNIQKTETTKIKKRWVALSLLINLGILAFFKYFNFFADGFQQMFSAFNYSFDPITLKIVLPVGISFYTFQTLSYSIDIYREKIKASTDFLDFALFVSFFPQLVAGPIERAHKLLPQISNARQLKLNQINAGIYLIFWGLFKKVVIADNVALITNQIFNNHTQYQGFDLIIAVVAFSVQIFCDFSAYSDIARGISKMMGFDLMLNFNLPYFAINPSDFWKRWHISLSSWLRDYLYIPLGGNKFGNFNTYKNLFLTMLLGGLWHGASWNFIWWGVFHGFILIIYRLLGMTDTTHLWRANTIKMLAQITIMFVLTLFGWLLFRVENMSQLSYFISNSSIEFSSESFEFIKKLLLFSMPLFIYQIWQYSSNNLMVILNSSTWKICSFYIFIFSMILFFGVRSQTEFIYFQF